MKRSSAAVISIILGLTTALVACSSADKPSDPCAENPKAKGCGKSAAAAPATTATPYEQPATTTTPPVQPAAKPDAGPPHKPDGGSIKPPEKPNTACLELSRCCSKVQDTIERALCVGIAYKASPSTCADAIIGYQIAGGCGHDPFSMPDFLTDDGNSANDCDRLWSYCENEPGGADSPMCLEYTKNGCGTVEVDNCYSWDDSTDSNGMNMYQCCTSNQPGNTFDSTACCGYDGTGCTDP